VFSAKNRSNFDLPFRTILSIYDRWQKCSRGFVVQAKAHKSHGLRDAQTALQAPAEQFGITNRQEKAGAGKCLGRADEGLEFAVKDYRDDYYRESWSACRNCDLPVSKRPGQL
jgi:hypothetical protein